MRAVNLLPVDAYAAKPKLPHAPIVLAATAPVLAGALVYLGYSLEHPKVADRRIALEIVQSQVAAMTPSQTLAAQASQVAAQRVLRQRELSDALGKQQPWDVALDEIGRVLPANAWLTQLSAQSPTPVTTATGAATATATIQGYTYAMTDVATVLARLSLLPSLKNVQLTSASASTIGTKNVIQFQITANVQAATS
ncbi:MAG TPA: PilN domain-containing protein [Gaiellaceae bacterium]|nr:PilN domain-containing protein [Gaiellaceae bacterium]